MGFVVEAVEQEESGYWAYMATPADVTRCTYRMVNCCRGGLRKCPTEIQHNTLPRVRYVGCTRRGGCISPSVVFVDHAASRERLRKTNDLGIRRDASSLALEQLTSGQAIRDKVARGGKHSCRKEQQQVSSHRGGIGKGQDGAARAIGCAVCVADGAVHFDGKRGFRLSAGGAKSLTPLTLTEDNTCFL